jgi:hypothetical protein
LVARKTVVALPAFVCPLEGLLSHVEFHLSTSHGLQLAP